MEGTQDIKHSLKDLKRMAKKQKKAKKKDKKMAKAEKRIAKQEAKLRKKGVFLEDVTTAEVVSEEDAPEDFTATPWIRKSTEDIPYLEKKIDRMAERRERSKLHDMFEEKFGESLMIPDTYKEYELSDAEKARLNRITQEEEVTEVETIPGDIAVTPGEQISTAEQEEGEGEAKKGRFRRKAKKAKAAKAPAVQAAPTGEMPLASWGKRILAFIIDCILLAPLAVLGILGMVVAPLVAIIYFMILEGTKGQSIGKMILKIKVTNMQGEKAGLISGLIQAIGKVIPILSLIDLIIGLVDKENKQRLFNKISKTIVINKDAVLDTVKSDVGTEAQPTTSR